MDFANPSRFLSFADRTLPWLSGLTVLVFAFGLDQAMIAPDDYQQGATVKIMFLHVPSAWLGMLGWGVMTVAALGHAGVAAPAGRRRGQGGGADRCRFYAAVPHHRLAVGPPDVGHLLGVGCAAHLGAGAVPALSRRHRAVAHRGGPLARGARRGDPHAGRRDRLPIIKFSVDWWNTLHQWRRCFASAARRSTSTILIPLLIMALAFTLLFATLLIATMRNEILRRRVRTLLLMQANATS